MNLQTISTLKSVESAFNKLKKKGLNKRDNLLSKRFDYIDKRALNSFGKYLKQTTPQKYYLNLKRYFLSPYTGAKIKKSNGKYRPLLIPSPQDRIILSIAFLKIRDCLKEDLIKNRALGLGFNNDIPKCQTVLKEIDRLIKTKRIRFILTLDFKDFFTSIDRKILLRRLTKYFKGKEQRCLFRLIKASIINEINAGTSFWKEFKELNLKDCGIPQGLSYSPLLASFYALPLDSAIGKFKASISYRYIDDMIILSPTLKEIKNVYKLIDKKSKKMNLFLHPLGGSKTKIIDIESDNFEFLGVGVSKEGLYIPKNAIDKFKKVFETEIVNDAIIKRYSFKEVINVYKNFVRGWTNYYKLCSKNYYEVEKELINYMDIYINKRKKRKTLKPFFKGYKLILRKPFIELI